MVNILRYGSFLRKRAEEDIHKRMAEHLSRIQIATKALHRSAIAWKEHNFVDLDKEVGIIGAEENAADRLLAEMWLQLTKGTLKSKLRSNILTFIKRVDEVANYAKRAGENFLILHDLKLPDHIFDEILKACELIHMATEKLAEALSIYRKDFQRTVDITTEISFLEHQVDGLYSRLKNHYFEYQKYSDNFGGLVIFDHAMRDLEKAANSAEDASDVLRSIVISEV
jgi:predicted phosphate transport protein (TIGR00153 family)